MANKKTRRRFMKINLMETSAVGIPAYPDAHMSFMKALSNYIQLTERGQDLNTMSKTDNVVADIKNEEEVVLTEEETVVEPEQSEEVKVEPTEEASEPVEEASEPEDSEKNFAELLSKALESAIENVSVKRGLIESQADNEAKAKEELSKLSAGELAIKSGWFSKF